VIKNNPAGFLISGALTSGGYAGKECRNAANFAMLEHVSRAPSSILGFDASKDGTGWVRVLTLTATTTTALVQVSAYYPYVRGVYVTGWSTSASAYMHYSPGLI
jgi:hypothetical protein